MIYLRYFESKSDIQFHVGQIKDLFQDIIDKYDIDETPGYNNDPGFYYMIVTGKDTIEFSISVNFYEDYDPGESYSYQINDRNLQLYEKFTSIKKDLISLDKRLKSIYKLNKDIRSSEDEDNEDEGYSRTEYNGEWWLIIEYEFEINI